MGNDEKQQLSFFILKKKKGLEILLISARTATISTFNKDKLFHLKTYRKNMSILWFSREKVINIWN